MCSLNAMDVCEEQSSSEAGGDNGALFISEVNPNLCRSVCVCVYKQYAGCPGGDPGISFHG